MRPAGPMWVWDVLLAAGVYAATALPFLFGLAMAMTPHVLAHDGGRPPTFPISLRSPSAPPWRTSTT